MTRRARRAARVLAPVVVALVLPSGCGVTSSSFRCQNAGCEITLNGAGADAEVDSLAATFQLTAIEDQSVTLEVLREGGGVDEEVTLAEGERAEVAGIQVICQAIDGDEVTLIAGPG